MDNAKEKGLGTAAAVGAYLMWGLFPLYWKQLSLVDPFQILCHRIIWAAVFTLVLLALQGKLPDLAGLARDKTRAMYAVAASILITVNWGTYIWAVNTGHVTESSLGYYINPLVSVSLGAIFFHEALDGFTSAAVAIAGLGVAVASVLAGTLPWISLLLALTFGFYGLVKKKAGLEPLLGLAAETLFALPFALAYLVFRHGQGLGAFGQGPGMRSFLLAFSGVVTALPLLCFAAAANRISLTRMGFIQYLSPSLQLALGVFVYAEALKPPMIVAFLSVILAVALYALSRGKAKGQASMAQESKR